MPLLSAPVTSRGVLYFTPPDRMARFTISPASTALLVEGRSVRFRDADGEQVDLSEGPVAGYVAENLVLLFGGDVEALRERYAVTLEGDEGGGGEWVLALVPRALPLSRVVAGIDLRGRGAVLESMEMRDRDDGRTLTRFEAVRADRAFAAAELARLFEDAAPLEDTRTAP